MAAAYSEHGGTVLNFAYRFVGDAQAAEDLTQEAFTRLVRDWASLGENGPRNARAWLLAVTRNLALDHIARRGTVVRGLPEVPRRPSPTTPDTCAERNETSDLLDAAVRELPPDLRAAVILCAIEGLSYKEAAAVCGCSFKALSSRLGRARQRLRDQVGPLVLGEES